MGQALGRAPVLPGARNFSNLPKSKIFELWGSFHEEAEGFGLTQDEFLNVLRNCLSSHLEFSTKKLDQIGKVVFTTLDDDANDLIDALEFLSSFAIMSGMTPTEKAQFVFGIFDFDECGVLSPDEVSFALRTTISGLCKLSAMDPPVEADIDQVALQATVSRKANRIKGHGKQATHVSLDDFITFCDTCPEVSSWMCCFGDLDEFGHSTLKMEETDEKCVQLMLHAGRTISRSGRAFAAMDLDSGGGGTMGIENRGLAKDICSQPPWRTDVVPYTEPSDCPVVIPESPPDVKLNIDWVYGMNTKQSRGSLSYTGGGDLVYPAGCLGVVFDLETGNQRYLNSHTDTITCLKVYIEPGDSIHKTAEASAGIDNAPKTLVVSGEAGKVPKVIVWSPGSRFEEPRVVSTLKGFHKDGISQVDWSPDGSMIVTVGASGMHSVAVYDWHRRALLFASPSSEPAVLGATWAGNHRFVTCGFNHINFWTCELAQQDPVLFAKKLEKGEMHFGKERGLFGKKSLNMPLLCVGGFGGLVVTGGATGHLNVWDGRNCIRQAKGHTGAMTCLHVLYDQAEQDSKPRGLVTGGSDGTIQLWNHQLELGLRFDGVSLLHPASPTIHSVVWDDFNHKVLVSFWSCEIFEVHDSEGYDIHDGPLVLGHHSHRTFGLAANPTDANEVATCGEDKTVRIWDAEKRCIKSSVTLDTMAHCVCFDAKGELLAVGLGYQTEPLSGFGQGAVPQRKDGAYLILKRTYGDKVGDDNVSKEHSRFEESMMVVHEGRDSKQPITCCAFSPNSRVLAMGSADGNVYLYGKLSLGGWGPTATCRGFIGVLTHVDFSTDSSLLQCCDSSGLLLFFEAEGNRVGEEVKKSSDSDSLWSSMKDTKWLDPSSAYGWGVQSCWGEFDDGTEVVCTARTHDRGTNSIVASVDSFSRIRLWRYPCATASPASAEYRGHGGGGISNAVFSKDDSKFFTIGQEDCCLIQWRVTHGGGVPINEACSEDVMVGTSQLDLKDTKEFERFDDANASNIDDKTKLFFMEERASDEDMSIVQPWQKSALPPSRPPPERVDEPSSALRLYWMYGFRALDCKQQVKYARPWGLSAATVLEQAAARGGHDNLICFFGGAVSAVLDASTNSMTFHRDHNDEVTCIAVHPTRSICATGQQGKYPFICVWDYRGTLTSRGANTSHGVPRNTKETLVTLHGTHRVGVRNICFSDCGKYLASISLDNWHTLTVHDWDNSHVICSREMCRETPFDLAFVPQSSPISQRELVNAGVTETPKIELVMVGVNTIKFITVTEGHNSEAKSASLGSEGMWQTFLCVGFLGVEPGASSLPRTDASAASPIHKPRLSAMRTVVGCQDGSLYLLAGTKLTQTFSAHSGPVNVISCHAEGMASGGHDGLIKVWKYADKTGLLTCTLVVDVAHYGSVLPVIRSLQFDFNTNRLLVGTLGSEIFELSARDGASTVVGGGPLLQGHAHTDAQTEVHGVASHPTLPRFATTGDDATLRIWDAENCAIIAMAALESPSRCCCFDPRGERIAIGLGSPIKKKAKQADGKFVIMGVGDFGILFEGVTQGQRYLTDAKWSPSGSVVAFASADSKIYLFNADDGFALKASCVAHDAPIRSMDFSANSSFILSNCSGGCLNFFDADTGHLITETAKIRDQKWSSCSASMQWSTAGCWPPQRDGTDVMCCDATGPQFNGNIPNGPAILATGDNFGRLKLFRYPCDSSLAHHKLYRAHGSAGPSPSASKGRVPRPQPAPPPCTMGEGWAGLSKIKWVGQGKWLISVSAKEKVMMQWLHEYDVDGDEDSSQAEKFHCNIEERLAALGVEDAESEVLEGMLDSHEGASASLNPDSSSHSKRSKKTKHKKQPEVPSSSLSALSTMSGDGTEEAPVRPWLTALVEPSDPESFGNPLTPPSLSGVALERCFGVAITVAGASKQSNIGYSGGKEGNLAIWGSASFGVVYDKKTHSQSIYRGHGGSAIGCISISPNGRYVATGETNKDRPLVKLWDAACCCELATLGPFHRRSIACLAWSHDCKKVVSVGGDMDHSICVWGTDSGLWEDASKIVDDSPRPSATSRPLASKLACGSGGPLPVYFACFLDQTCWGPGGLYNHANSVHDSASASSAGGGGSRHPGYLFSTGGVDHIMLWSLEGRTLSNERGLWGVGKKVQPMLCGDAAGRRLISGALSGHLYSWLGRRCEKMVKAHRGAVSSIWTATFSDGIEGRVVSGGIDGCVNVYDGSLQPLCRFDLLNDSVNGKCDVPPLLPIIRGVGGAIAFGGNLGKDIKPNVDSSKAAVLPTGEFVNRVIVSTASAEIYELSPDSGSWSLLAEGHYTDPNKDGSHAQLWGLSAHPTQADLVATCGDDGIVSVWSLGLGRMLRKAQLDSAARCVAWSPDGTLLLVGMGGSAVPGRGRQSKDGCLVLLDSSTLQVLLEARDAQHWLRACSFSPGGETFGVCSQDGSIYLYDTRGRTLRAKCGGFSNGAAMSLDFSVDGAYVQCDGGAGKGYEHLYFSGGDGVAFSLPSQLKNVKWASWTCRLGWPMLGAWPQTTGGGYDRNLAEPTSCDRSKKGDLLAVGYEDGRIRIFRYPCLLKSAPNVMVIAHAGPVALVRFSCDGKYLLSIGKEDRALLAWKIIKNDKDISALTLSTSTIASDSSTITHAITAQTANGLVGAQVLIHGMVDNTDLNGCEGLVLDYRTHPTRRYTVKIEGDAAARVLLIKPGNLKKAPVVLKSTKSRGSRKSGHRQS